MKFNTVKFIIFSFLLFLSLSVSAQNNIVVHADNEPINKVLINLSTSYNINISFNDELLSGKQISIDSTFASIEDVLIYMLVGNGLDYELENDVWVIFPLSENKKTKKNFFRIYY